MSSYENWLKKNKLENEEALRNRQKKIQLSLPVATPMPQPQSVTIPIATTQPQSATMPTTRSQSPSRSGDNGEQSASDLLQSTSSPNNNTLKSQTDIVFQNDKMELCVEKAAFQKQKRFRLLDHHFHIKIKLKNLNDSLPFLKDILDFLQQGLLHVFKELKSFYNEKDANLGFITLFQEPMIVALNSGILNK
jgi:hypothetical protein